MQIGLQEHQVLVVEDKTVVNVIHAASHHAIVVEWRCDDAAAPRVIANSAKRFLSAKRRLL